MHLKYLVEHHPNLWNQLVLVGKLWKHLAEIDAVCIKRMDCIISAMKEREGVTEALKGEDQMEWVRRMNSIRNRAEEIVLTELVFT